jgi:hypothetical protein
MRGNMGAALNLDPACSQPVQFVDFDFDTPRFIVTVDTEEEFDWTAPFTRDVHGTTHVGAIDRFQRLCDDNGVRPAYLVDYPIVNDVHAVELLGRYVSDRRADVGVQLHPWVNPPFQEEPSIANSYACNLSPELERAKLTTLHTMIVDRFGVKPQMYRAGRYGAGLNSRKILRELGVAIDTSVRSLFDYSGQGGPNYSDAPLEPYWIAKGELIELPVTSVFSGALRSAGKKIFSRPFDALTSRALLARTGMLERIALTPEGIPAEKAMQAIDISLRSDIPILNFSFHSPSLAVGHTPYVRTPEELERFYDWWVKIFAYLKACNVQPIHVNEIVRSAGIKLPE